MMHDKDENTRIPSSTPDMKLDIGQISAGGHVVISGRDATIQGNNRGSIEETQILIIGGVETTAEHYQKLEQSLDQLDKTIATAPLPQDAQAAAKRNAEEFRTQLTSKNKPNEYLLVQAGEALYQFGPDVAGALIGTFTNPLVGQIMALAGRKALDFYRRLRSDETPSAPATP